MRRLLSRVPTHGLPAHVFGYILFIDVAALIAVIFAARSTSLVDLPAAVALLVIAVSAERIVLPLPRGGELAPSTMLYLGAILLLPLGPAILLVATGTLIGELLGRKAWYRVAFNVGQITLAFQAAGLAWEWLGDRPSTPVGMLNHLPAAFTAIVIYYVLNTWFTSGALALSLGGNVWEIWWANHRRVLLPHVGMQVMGLLFATACLFDVRMVALMAVPSVITWVNFRYIARLEVAGENERMLRTRSERLAARWESLASVAARLAPAVDPAAVLRTGADLIVEFCADSAVLRLPDGRSACAAHPGIGPVPIDAVDALPEGGAPHGAFAHVQAIPLLVAGSSIATLYVGWTVGPPQDEAEALLQPTIERIAIALQNALLIEQSSELEAVREIARLKGEFLASVGHELHAPLGLIVGYGELLQQNATQPENVAWMAERIRRGGERLSRMVDELLDAGRLESGRFSLARQRLDVGALVDLAVEQARASSGSAAIHVCVDPNTPAAHADPNRCQQVLANLLSNAIRYAGQAGTIRVIAGPLNGLPAIAVEDNGPGVPPAERTKIFGKFYRAPGAAGKSQRGLGLGLAIAKDIVVAHGGNIWVESAASGGARFVFVLPAADGAGM